MPADRTPAVPLSRGLACLACRTRKVKCDGTKPACGGCRKGAAAKGENPDTVACRYDDAAVKPSRKSGSSNNSRKLAELESKIADLQKQVDRDHTSDADLLQNFSSTTPPDFFASNVAEGSALDGYQAVQPDSFLMDLIYPGWPTDMPDPELTHRLVHAFFDKPNSASFMISKTRFMSTFLLPPKHANFPHTALLHSILAVVLNLNSSKSLGVDDKLYWRTIGNELMPSPALYHAKRSKFHIDIGIENGTKLMQLAQAINMLNVWSYSNARFVEVWLYCGLATRICPPMALNHAESNLGNVVLDAARVSGNLKHAAAHVRKLQRTSMLPPPMDDIERFERASVFWASFICDRFASHSSGWCNSLDEEDITTFLPSPGASLAVPFANFDSLSLWSDSFFVSHPRGIVGPLQLGIKATILLGRSNRFIQRAPWPVGTGERLFAGKKRGRPQTALDVCQSEEFKLLDADVVSFRLSFHREAKAVISNMHATEDDVWMLLAFSIAHTAGIALHEPFCTTALNDPSMERCLTSARAILSSVYSLMAATYDVTDINPFLVSCWHAAGRTLVREYAIQQERNDVTAQARAMQEATTILSAMLSMRTPLADDNAKGLRELIENPQNMLPCETLSLEGASSRWHAPEKAMSIDRMNGAPMLGTVLTGMGAGAQDDAYQISGCPVSHYGLSPPVHSASGTQSSTLASPFDAPSPMAEEMLQEAYKSFNELTSAMVFPPQGTSQPVNLLDTDWNRFVAM